MSENQKSGVSLGSGELGAALKEVLRQYENVCADMEHLAQDAAIDDHAARGAELAAAFAALPPLPEEFAELLEKRFAAASAAVERAAAGDAARREAAAGLRAGIRAIRDAGELATAGEIAALKSRWDSFWGGAAPAAAEWNAELGELEAKLAAEAAEQLRRGEAAEKLAAELDELTASGDPEALKLRRPEIEAAYAALGNVPRPQNTRYQEAHRRAQTLLARHYETLDYARWESYTLKLDLLAELERLRGAPEGELGAASKRLVEIRERWKELGSVPREKSEEVNPRYLELTRAIQHRVDEYFANRRQEQKSAAAEKQKLCEEAEANASRTDWGSGSAAFRELQTRWKSLPRAGARETELFARFHAAAERFFSARNAVFAERDRQHAAAAARKRQLIAEIETLTDVRRAKSMRAEFNAIGSAGREEGELFRAFNAALDKFFSARNAAFAEKEREASVLIGELEALAGGDPVAGSARAREIRRRFDELGCRRLSGAMSKAERSFSDALREAEKQLQAERWEAYRTAARAASELLNDPAAPVPEQVMKFPRLAASIELARAAAGDEKAAGQWKKQLARNESECARITAAAATVNGEVRHGGASGDLAAELQAAIMGNFARREAEASRPRADLASLRREFMSLGALPAEALLPALEALSGGKTTSA